MLALNWLKGFFLLRFTNLNQLLVDGVVVSNQPPIRSSWSLLFAHGSNHTMTFASAISFGLCGSDVGIPFGNEFAFGQVDLLLVVSFGFVKEDWLTHRRAELTDFRRHVPRSSKVFPWCSSILPLHRTSPFQLPSFSTKSSGVEGWSDSPLPPVCTENLFPVSITAVVKIVIVGTEEIAEICSSGRKAGDVTSWDIWLKLSCKTSGKTVEMGPQKWNFFGDLCFTVSSRPSSHSQFILHSASVVPLHVHGPLDRRNYFNHFLVFCFSEFAAHSRTYQTRHSLPNHSRHTESIWSRLELWKCMYVCILCCFKSEATKYKTSRTLIKPHCPLWYNMGRGFFFVFY